MKTLHTFNQYHLGDQLVHLHFLRALAKAHPEIFFTHTCDARHLAQLQPVVADLANLSLSSDWANLRPGAINAWRGVEGHWHHHPLRNDFAAYHLRWFETLAQRMDGLRSPFTKPEDLLFDYPALKSEYAPEELKRILVINCPPRSGQWAGYDQAGMNQLAATLWGAGHVVLTVLPTGNPDIRNTEGLDVTAIGRLSINADVIIGCVTGPMWPTLNVWNAGLPTSDSRLSANHPEQAQRVEGPLRIHLLDTERVELCANTVHANSLTLVPEILKDRGLL